MKKNKKHSDLKICSCDADGFSYQTNNTLTRIKWMEIESLTAYKADLLTSDEILIDVLHNNLILTISEVTPGWEEFILKTKSIFPGIPRDWDILIVKPPFATNQITLYQKQH